MLKEAGGVQRSLGAAAAEAGNGGKQQWLWRVAPETLGGRGGKSGRESVGHELPPHRPREAGKPQVG